MQVWCHAGSVAGAGEAHVPIARNVSRGQRRGVRQGVCADRHRLAKARDSDSTQDNGVVSVREGEDELVRLGDLSGLDDLGFQCLDRDKVPLVKMRHTETFADAPWHTAMPADERSTTSRGDLI